MRKLAGVMNRCYLCGGNSFSKRPGRVRDRRELDVLQCRSCGLVFLSSFDHITPGFYENSGMNGGVVNPDDWLRATARDDERRFRTLESSITNKSVLDFGCGNGGFLVRAGRVAARAVGIEPDRSLKAHFHKEELTVYAHPDEIDQTFDVITLFHVLEHLLDPVTMLRRLAGMLRPDGSIIIEVPNADDALLTLYECDAFSRFTYWSCHLYLFNAATLALLAQKAGLKTDYIKQVQRYPLSNHLYWLAQHKPGGNIRWNFLDSRELHDAYERQLGLMNRCDTLLAGFGAGHD
jgi:2-polyprenyl-3-methyl-5-hydroxy-6-metoxy-1,4-benzoquinol methylase